MTEKESFIRWQGRTIEELGKAINLLLGLCLATIGFVVSKLLDKDFHFINCNSRLIVFVGSIILLITVILLLFLIYNRLHAFKGTTQIARKRETNDRDNINSLRTQVNQKDKLTWTLFNLSIVAFSLGELLVILGFIIEISNR